MKTTTARPVSPPALPARSLLALTPAAAERGAWQTLTEHRTRYAVPPHPRSKPWTELIDAIDRAGLRGRGGAGFPTAVKMATVAGGRGRAVVLANGTEGEPASYKDKLLLSHQPHLVLDGALLAAAAVGAGHVVIGVEETARQALGAVRRALAERASAEPAGIPVEVVATPPGYVSGEESALVAFVNGGPALPTGRLFFETTASELLTTMRGAVILSLDVAGTSTGPPGLGKRAPRFLCMLRPFSRLVEAVSCQRPWSSGFP